LIPPWKKDVPASQREMRPAAGTGRRRRRPHAPAGDPAGRSSGWHRPEARRCPVATIRPADPSRWRSRHRSRWRIELQSSLADRSVAVKFLHDLPAQAIIVVEAQAAFGGQVVLNRIPPLDGAFVVLGKGVVQLADGGWTEADEIEVFAGRHALEVALQALL